MNHHARERDLVQVVVEDLPQRTAVVSASRLLAVYCVHCLIPESGEPAENPDPPGQRLGESRI